MVIQSIVVLKSCIWFMLEHIYPWPSLDAHHDYPTHEELLTSCLRARGPFEMLTCVNVICSEKTCALMEKNMTRLGHIRGSSYRCKWRKMHPLLRWLFRKSWQVQAHLKTIVFIATLFVESLLLLAAIQNDLAAANVMANRGKGF